MRATPSECSSVSVATDKGGKLWASVGGGPSSGSATTGGVGCVTTSVIDKGMVDRGAVDKGVGDNGLVTVTTTVWVRRWSKEMVGVGVATGEVRTMAAVVVRVGMRVIDLGVVFILTTLARCAVAVGGDVGGVATETVGTGVEVEAASVCSWSAGPQLVARKTASKVNTM